MVEDKEFTFEIDGESFIKWFRPDAKLEDVREKLAEGRDGWEAEKILFKQSEIRICREDEIHYKLEEIQVRKSDKCVIYIENLIKKVKAHVDDKVFTLSLDPNDKLEKIRLTLLGKYAKLFSKEGINFNFRWESGRVVDECEEITNNLEEILINGNELRISILQESEITIYSNHSGNFEPSIYTLHKGMKLTEIRKKLENTWKEQCHFYMCPDCCFLNQEKSRILKSDEDKLILSQILLIDKNGLNVLNICREHDGNNYDLVKLMNKCGYGFITKNGSVEQAKYRAFTIVETPDQHIFQDKYEHNTFKCKNEFHELCERNFIKFGNTTTCILPWVSIFFGVNRETSFKKLEEYEKFTEYSYVKIRRVSINISKNNISVSREFIHEVKQALEETAQDKKVEKLKKIVEKYGYFYANSVYFGGVIIKKDEEKKYSNEHTKNKELGITAEISSQIIKVGAGSTSKIGQNIKTATGNTESGCTIKGGDFSKFNFDKFDDREDWINSLKDPKTWDIIEYHHIGSIFSLLEEDLQTKVLEALGKRILKAEVDEIKYQTDKERHIYELAEKLSDIPNIKDCQIFTTIIKVKIDKHIFSTCVSYDGSSDKPIIIINRAPSKKRPRRKFIPVRIGWIVVGYPTDTFDFDLSNQIVIESKKCEMKQYTINNDDFPHLNNLQFIKKYALATCVLDNMAITLQGNANISTISSSMSNTNRLNARDLKLVVGRKDVQYDSFLQDLKLFICVIYIKEKFYEQYFYEDKVKWKHMGIGKNSRTLYSETDQIDTNDRPTFINHLFDKAIPDDDCHGIINVAPNNLQYRILNKHSFGEDGSDISCFRIPPENEFRNIY
ncbi:hsp70 family protein [Gigaspora margarita]|uniref:Hsp70 family protein n=1 Tax=Gigaspora margarita TaxID=4874 RepID=A0A8H4AW35_GIGMA|nr:hsp70 family protein [Gigaspora margarita]